MYGHSASLKTINSRNMHMPHCFFTIMNVQDLGQPKVKTEIFSKRTPKISKIIFIQGSYKYLASLEKLEGALSFHIHNCKKISVMLKHTNNIAVLMQFFLDNLNFVDDSLMHSIYI